MHSCSKPSSRGYITSGIKDTQKNCKNKLPQQHTRIANKIETVNLYGLVRTCHHAQYKKTHREATTRWKTISRQLYKIACQFEKVIFSTVDET